MPRRVEKSDPRAFVIYGVSADVLRDAAGFPRRDARFADRVHERSLAVIDVPHEGDDRTAQFEFFFLLDDWRRWRDDDLFDFVHAATFFAALHLENKAVLLANFRGDFGLYRQVRVRENIEIIHQLFDELEIFHAERRREFFYDDRRFDVNDLFAVGRFVDA